MLEQQLEMKSEEIRRLKEGVTCYYGVIMNLLQMVQKTTDCNVLK